MDEREARINDLLAEYGEEPSGKGVLGSDGRRYEVEPYRDPLASSKFKQFDWAKEHPQVAGSLAQLFQYLSMLPMGRSPRMPEQLAWRDKSTAGMLERRADRIDSMDPGITGAQGARGLGVYNPIYRQSAAGLQRENPAAIRSIDAIDDRFDPVFQGAISGRLYRGPEPPANANNLRFDVIPGGKAPKKPEPSMTDAERYDQAVHGQQMAPILDKAVQNLLPWRRHPNPPPEPPLPWHYRLIDRLLSSKFQRDADR